MPADVDDIACDVEQVGVAVVQQITGDAVGLLVDHGRDTGADLGFVEDIVLAEFRDDLAIVGVLGQLARDQGQRAEVVDRLRLGQDATLELVGDPETFAGLEEILRVVRDDGVELDAVVDQLQHGGLRCGRNRSGIRFAELGTTGGQIGREVAPGGRVVDDTLEVRDGDPFLGQQTEELGSGIKLGADRFEGCDGIHRVPLSFLALLTFS